jgi:hypothetical protein
LRDLANNDSGFDLKHSAAEIWLREPGTAISITNGIITTVAGNGGLGYSDDGISAVDAGVIILAAMAADSSGNLYFTDSGYGRSKLMESLLLTVAGIGAPFTIMQQTSAAALASLAQPVGVAVNSAGALLSPTLGTIASGLCPRKV